MRRVLVVEDNVAIRELVRDLLRWAGHETATAPDGVAALEMVQRWSPDVIILDSMMPRMDGRQFAQHYRLLPGPHAPIIAMTAAHNGAQWAADLEAIGFVGKPFHADELLRLVAQEAPAQSVHRPVHFGRQWTPISHPPPGAPPGPTAPPAPP